jgi:hypothetical protein
MHVQLPHEIDAVRLDGFDAQLQVRCYKACHDLLRRLSLCDTL